MASRCLLGLPLAAPAWAQQPTVPPFLPKYCAPCHNAKLKTATLAGRETRLPPEVWSKVLDKLTAQKMPPPPMAQPPKAETAAVVAWIRTVVETHTDTNPGRVTTRRLNRAEYNNTIRDLLGVHLRPADEFPLDDSGYGFDNNGDVLSLSPLLMEKYITAARRISQVAVYGETFPAKPGLLARLMPKKGHDEPENLATNTYLPYSMRGALYGTFPFPVEAEYEFRIRITNFRGQDERDLSPEVRARLRARPNTAEERKDQDEVARTAFPPVKMVLAVDGKPVYSTIVEGSTQYDYARGFSIARVRLNAGEHSIRASFPEYADMPDSRKNINPDGRRKIYVDYLDRVGPFQPSTQARESYKRIFICGHPRGQHQPSCARTIVANVARRASRRPLSDREADALVNLAALVHKERDSFEAGVRVALHALLM